MEEFSEKCLLDLPWNVVNNIHLYDEMNLSFNALTYIPAELPLRLPHLCYLNISFNQLTEIPEGFAYFIHLKTLLLSHNKIVHISVQFTRLANLEKLDISQNALQNLPEEIGNMQSLKKLNVSHNKLTSLPDSLGCEQLQVLLAVGNRYAHLLLKLAKFCLLTLFFVCISHMHFLWTRHNNV